MMYVEESETSGTPQVSMTGRLSLFARTNARRLEKTGENLFALHPLFKSNWRPQKVISSLTKDILSDIQISLMMH
jgi:hypothetical protein